MARYVLSSHDGFGLGHVRRNSLIARALLDADPGARVTIVTGLPLRASLLELPDVDIVRVPPLLKDRHGSYRSAGMPFEEALARRESIFATAIDRLAPDVVVVDRHPYGTAGELHRGLWRAKRNGAAIVLGLRDILDEPEVVEAELAGKGWEGVPELFTSTLVYGSRHLCDHENEYGLPVRPTYCGWVTEQPVPTGDATRQDGLLAVAAGGGGDGDSVFRLGVQVLERRPSWRAELAAGPYADARSVGALAAGSSARSRLTVARDVAGCVPLFTRASAVLQMAGYNSTFEALAAGHRPILVPRRNPRREQAIRASRLAAMGLADVVDETASASEVDWLLDQPRSLSPIRLRRAGIDLDGGRRAAGYLAGLAHVRAAA